VCTPGLAELVLARQETASMIRGIRLAQGAQQFLETTRAVVVFSRENTSANATRLKEKEWNARVRLDAKVNKSIALKDLHATIRDLQVQLQDHGIK